MAISTKNITTGVQIAPPRITIYGVPGVGKTTLAAQFPGAVFIFTEDGRGVLDLAAFPLAQTFTDVMDALDALLTEDHDFQTVVVDSLDWLERLIWDHVCAAGKCSSIEDFGYGKGYVLALNTWRTYLDKLGRLRAERGMAIVQIAHSLISRFNSPLSEPYDRYKIKLHEKAAGLVMEGCDAVLFTNYRVHVTKDGEAKTPTNIRGVGQGERILHTSERPAFWAKTRYRGMPQEMEMSYDAIIAGIMAST